jgi:hypothetical protein
MPGVVLGLLRADRPEPEDDAATDPKHDEGIHTLQ